MRKMATFIGLGLNQGFIDIVCTGMLKNGKFPPHLFFDHSAKHIALALRVSLKETFVDITYDGYSLGEKEKKRGASILAFEPIHDLVYLATFFLTVASWIWLMKDLNPHGK
jgi:hypothetical protein